MPFAIIAIIVVVFFLCLRIVPQASEYVIERLGKYKKTWEAGLHILIPLIDRTAKKGYIKRTGA